LSRFDNLIGEATMTLIPAVCENPNCRTVFLTENWIEVSPGSSAFLSDSHFGPCPKCGEWGLVPSGTYTQVGLSTLFEPLSNADRQLLENALQLATTAVNSDMSPEAFKDAAQQVAPELSALWKLLPTTKQDAYQFWMLVIAAIGAILLAYQVGAGGPQQITVPKEIIDAIHAARRENPGDNRTSPSPKTGPQASQPKE
jgi:hypothetical protein